MRAINKEVSHKHCTEPETLHHEPCVITTGGIKLQLNVSTLGLIMWLFIRRPGNICSKEQSVHWHIWGTGKQQVWQKESRKRSRHVGQRYSLVSCSYDTFQPHVSKTSCALYNKNSCICIPLRRRHFWTTCLADVQLHFSTFVCFGVLAVVTKACLCVSGETDDGVCGAQGSRWCYAVKGRGVRLHSQSALHLQRGWDRRVPPPVTQ